MNVVEPPPALAFFIPGAAGKLFALYHAPRDGASYRGDVILLPPFAEEMNKSRHMLALQARALTAQGLGALILDLYGTGESEGEFGDARWDVWLSDVSAAYAWLQARHSPGVNLLGLRFGALLALACSASTAMRVRRVVVWQPVLSGEAMITQFLRLRLAASMLASTEERQSMQTLRESLQRGEMIEVAGYDLAPDLVSGLAGVRLETLAQASGPDVHWLELSGDAPAAISPASRRVVESWRHKGVSVTAAGVSGPPFWSSVELALAPALLQVTNAVFNH